MRWFLATVLATGLAMGCRSGPTAERCRQLLDHLVDLEFKKAGAAATSEAMKAEIASQKKAVSEAKADEFIATCEKQVSRARVECALSAADIEAVARCDEANK